MLKTNLIANCLACAAAIGMIMPVGALNAQTPVQTTTTTQLKTYDVVLAQGKLTGQHLTSTGAGLAGAKISVKQAGVEVARTTTDAKGVFVINGLKNGVYEVVTPQGTLSARVWDAAVAPPTAQSTITIVSGDAVRGQLGGVDGFHAVLLGLGIAGTTLGIIALADDPEAPATVVPASP